LEAELEANEKPLKAIRFQRLVGWLRGQDLNLRPSDYEPDHRQLEIRPICTPELPSGHTGALDFFLAGEAYDLIAADDHGSGAGMCGKDEESNRGIRIPDRRKMRHVVKTSQEPSHAAADNVQCPLNRLGGSDQYCLTRT
jgi:hypothetical protein